MLGYGDELMVLRCYHLDRHWAYLVLHGRIRDRCKECNAACRFAAVEAPFD